MFKVTIGSDPELFIYDSKKKKVISAVGLLPGTKENPYVDEEFPRSGFGLQTDNILGEFNIPPAMNMDDFVSSIEYMKGYIRKKVKEINPDYDIKCCGSQKVCKDQLQTDQAKLFGCDPDYNVYTEKQNEVGSAKDTNLRSAGCHFHIGYEKPNIETSLQMLKYIDAYVGVPSVLKDPDVERRQLYGRAGCFRLQPWGFEYRVLSSYFISSTEIIKWVYNQLQKAIGEYSYCGPLPKESFVVETINNSNKLAAKILSAQYNME